MAYDTETGTLKNYRGTGLAKKIFEYSVPYLKQAGIKQYLLEVLQHNVKAVSVYRNIGFEVVREFNYYIHRSDSIVNNVSALDNLYSIRNVKIEGLYDFSDFWDFCPSWQNSFESIKRASDNFVSLGVFFEDKLLGYCVFEPISGDLTQIAVDKQHRRKGAGSLLLNEISKLNKNSLIKIVNTDTSCDSITNFLISKKLNITGSQFEMIKEL